MVIIKKKSYPNLCFRVKSPGLNNVWNILVRKDRQELIIFSMIKFSVNIIFLFFFYYSNSYYYLNNEYSVLYILSTYIY